MTSPGSDRASISCSLVTIVISEHEHPEQALIFSRLGVAECMIRPLDLNRLSYLIDVLTIQTRYGLPSRHRIAEPDLGEVKSLGDERPFVFLPGDRMGRTIEQIKRVAPRDTTVMIGGETGTGKTHLAGLIHSLSPRRDQPFLTINCGALAANLIESEMFGHARGSFTGADAERTGKFCAVGRGTLFLDEDRSAPLELAGQSSAAGRGAGLGSRSARTAVALRLQARLVVASNRPLEGEVAAGRFRADLFYRLNVIAFDIPPLRERIAVLPALALAMLAAHGARDGRRVDGIAPSAMQALLAHSWPGNVRELRNVIERAVALGHGSMIELDDLPGGTCIRPRPPSGCCSAPAAVDGPSSVASSTDSSPRRPGWRLPGRGPRRAADRSPLDPRRVQGQVRAGHYLPGTQAKGSNRAKPTSAPPPSWASAV